MWGCAPRDNQTPSPELINAFGCEAGNEKAFSRWGLAPRRGGAAQARF